MNKEYLKAFLGKNYNTVMKGSFSFMALIFGPFYLLYKNILIKGILFLTIICLTYYYNESLALFITVIINLYLGFFFHKIYLDFAQKRIDEIKIKNPNKSSSELLKIYEKKSHPTIYIIICITICAILLIIIPHFLIPKTEENYENKLYDLSYTIPKNFHTGKYNTDQYKHYYYIDSENNCSITITGNNQKKIEEKAETKEINQNLWSLTKDTYQIEKDNILYEVTYQIEKGSQCEQMKELFLTSLKFEYS